MLLEGIRVVHATRESHEAGAAQLEGRQLSQEATHENLLNIKSDLLLDPNGRFRLDPIQRQLSDQDLELELYLG